MNWRGSETLTEGFQDGRVKIIADIILRLSLNLNVNIILNFPPNERTTVYEVLVPGPDGMNYKIKFYVKVEAVPQPVGLGKIELDENGMRVERSPSTTLVHD